MNVLRDFWEQLKQRFCRHECVEYEEVRLQDGESRSWSAFWCCRDCGEVLGVEGSYSGAPARIREALGEEK